VVERILLVNLTLKNTLNIIVCTETFTRSAENALALIGNKSVPKAQINDTINLFFKLQSAFW